MNKHKLVLEILGGTELLWLCWIVGFFCGKGTLAGVGLTALMALLTICVAVVFAVVLTSDL